MPVYASSDHVRFGLLAETTEGTFETSAAFKRQLITGATPEYNSTIAGDSTISGAGEPIDKRTQEREFGLQTPAKLRFKDCRLIVGAFLRDTPPAEVSIVGSSDINVVSGTHLDGSSGWQITAPASALDSLINYGGVTVSTHPRGGAECLWMKVSGSAQGANNKGRRIKAVHDDGTAKIDIWAAYTAGAASTPFEPMVATTNESITIKVGTAMRNRGTGGSSYSALWQYTDLSSANWQSGWGLVGNDLGTSWSGTDGAEMTASWMGYAAGEIVSADPSGQGFTDADLAWSPMMMAGDDLQILAIMTATTPIVLSSFNLTGFQSNVAGNCQRVKVSGTSETTGIVRGSHNPSGSIEWNMAADARTLLLSQLGSRSNAEKAGIDAVFRDPDGAEIVIGHLWNEFSPAGGVPGSQNSVVAGSSLTFEGLQRTPTSRSYVHQEFSA